ncbi:hypothetical protein [Photobacterium leiognathi]|uniref:hypothetical protein n=1 Tax=Photobacterium leiognathi TaxID=553611 RepID=UPI002739006B|nr:hypothetical protein [Photobacterium leiognathi]
MFTAKKWWIINFALACFYSSTVFACSPEDSNYVEQGFNNGAKWTMCWEFDGDEGIYACQPLPTRRLTAIRLFA